MKIIKEELNGNLQMNIINKHLTVNEYFDHVYLLNLNRRIDRLEKVSKKLKQFNIKFERFNAIDGNDINNFIPTTLLKNKFEYACLLSHISILKDAKEKKYKRILVFEDDIMISENFNEHFQKVKGLDDWEMLYLGAAQYDLPNKNYNWDNIKFKNGFYIANITIGAFAYGINFNIYDKIINYFNNNSFSPIDIIFSDIIQPSNKSYVFYPNIIIADVSNSDIRPSRNVEYHKIKMKWNILNDYV